MGSDLKPLLSVIVPTFNSAGTIKACLESVRQQTYQRVELIVVDSESRDDSLKIVEYYQPKVIRTRWRLLGSRYLGFVNSSGDYVLHLDSDQVLERTSLERAVKMMSRYDMLILEEGSYMPKTLTQRLFAADRKLVHALTEVYKDPLEGVLLSRLYRRVLMEKSFDAIPRELLPTAVAHDHAIIYYEACRVSHRVGILRNAVWHIEPLSLSEVLKKNFRYGKNARQLVRNGHYSFLLSRKVRLRKGTLLFARLWFTSLLLGLIKASAYEVGYRLG